VAEGAATRSAASRATPPRLAERSLGIARTAQKSDNPAVGAPPFTEGGNGQRSPDVIRGWVERPLAPAPGRGALTALSSVMAGPDPATQPDAHHAWEDQLRSGLVPRIKSPKRTPPQ